MHLPRRTAVTVTALALTGVLVGCSDDQSSPESEIVEPAGAEPGVDAAEPGVDEAEPGSDGADAPDAPAIDVEPTPQ